MFFQYKVNYIPPDLEKVIEEKGLVYASNYVEATNKVMKYFGEENVVDMYLQAWDTYNCITLDEIKEGFKLT